MPLARKPLTILTATTQQQPQEHPTVLDKPQWMIARKQTKKRTFIKKMCYYNPTITYLQDRFSVKQSLKTKPVKKKNIICLEDPFLAAPYQLFFSKRFAEDAVCVDQTDGEMKERGIYGIGGWLSVSRELRILWSPPYFSPLDLSFFFNGL